jgi:hypothetical protein
VVAFRARLIHFLPFGRNIHGFVAAVKAPNSIPRTDGTGIE